MLVEGWGKAMAHPWEGVSVAWRIPIPCSLGLRLVLIGLDQVRG